jgi:hypothetical protein
MSIKLMRKNYQLTVTDSTDAVVETFRAIPDNKPGANGDGKKAKVKGSNLFIRRFTVTDPGTSSRAVGETFLMEHVKGELPVQELENGNTLTVALIPGERAPKPRAPKTVAADA